MNVFYNYYCFIPHVEYCCIDSDYNPGWVLKGRQSLFLQFEVDLQKSQVFENDLTVLPEAYLHYILVCSLMGLRLSYFVALWCCTLYLTHYTPTPTRINECLHSYSDSYSQTESPCGLLLSAHSGHKQPTSYSGYLFGKVK